MLLKIILSIIVLFASIAPASSEQMENEYGSVNAWFNGQEATVKNIKLKINEPVEIKVTITSKIDGNVYVKLTNPLITEPYDVINGPSVIGQTLQNGGITTGWS